jgi:hypothetical protein
MQVNSYGRELLAKVSTSKREDPTEKKNKRQNVQRTFILQRVQLLARLAVRIMSVKRVLVIAGSDSSGGA